jgi:hypothetical protein
MSRFEELKLSLKQERFSASKPVGKAPSLKPGTTVNNKTELHLLFYSSVNYYSSVYWHSLTPPSYARSMTNTQKRHNKS